MHLRDAELLVQTRSPPAALGCGAAAPRGGGGARNPRRGGDGRRRTGGTAERAEEGQKLDNPEP